MPTRLVLRGYEPISVFGLLGNDENAASVALGWALRNSRMLLDLFIHHLGLAPCSSDVIVELQRHGGIDRGFTDIEIRVPDDLHIIIEAKQGWALPSPKQLARYAGRLQGSSVKLLVSLSAAAASYATPVLPSAVRQIPVLHLSWTEVRGLLRQASLKTRRWQERLWLSELDQHLGGYVADQLINSNLVYVVSLSQAALAPGYTWIDVVEQTDRYFHPYGAGSAWPVTPPNYLGFRYGGQLQAVRHVQKHEIVPDLGACDPRWAALQGTHILYRLGPPMRPTGVVKTGKLFRAARVSCAIDTLLSGQCKTISDARDETAKRLGSASKLGAA